MMKAIGISNRSVYDAKSAPNESVFFVCDDGGNILWPAHLNADVALGAVAAIKNKAAVDIQNKSDTLAAFLRLRRMAPAVCAWNCNDENDAVAHFGNLKVTGNSIEMELSDEGQNFIGSASKVVQIKGVRGETEGENLSLAPSPFRKD